MQIQINSDNYINANKEFSDNVHAVVQNKLIQYKDRISRIEVHFSDENGPKKGFADQRCSLEVRIEGLLPVGVSYRASTIELALAGATKKIKNLLTTKLGRLRDHH